MLVEPFLKKQPCASNLLALYLGSESAARAARCGFRQQRIDQVNRTYRALNRQATIEQGETDRLAELVRDLLAAELPETVDYLVDRALALARRNLRK